MTPEPSPVKVFLAEDHEPDVMLIEEALETAGIPYSLDWYEDGESAEFKLNEYDCENRPDIILLDINLPRQNGFILLERIRQNPVLAKVPVAIVTSSRALADRERAAALGVEAFVTKPTRLDDFLNTIASTVQHLLALTHGKNRSAGGPGGVNKRPCQSCGLHPGRTRHSRTRRIERSPRAARASFAW